MISERTRTKFAELAHYLEHHRKGRWLVLSHDNPDPDALISAAMLGQILERAFHCRVTIAYGGIIGRAENQEMCRLLGLQMSRLRHISWKNYRHFALVDTQPHTGNNQLPLRVTPDLVIDHHPSRRKSLESPFVDIRPSYGATASILSEYLLVSDLPVTRNAATGLVYAIRSETQAFSRESSGPDQLLYDHFLPLVNKRNLGKIQFPKLPRSYLRTLSEALTALEEAENVIVCHLSTIETPDIVPEIADLLLRLEGKTWCLTTGPFEDRIYLAIRTTNTRADAGGAMRRILGRRGKGGGHGMIAGGWFPIDDEPDAALKAQRRLALRLLRILKKDPRKLSRIALDDKTESP